MADPIAVPLVGRVLDRPSVTPNRLTAAAVAVGWAAAAAFAFGATVAGALLFQVSFAIDCMDGKLAASRGTSSRWGGWIDLVGDALTTIPCVLALIGRHVVDGHDSPALTVTARAVERSQSLA